VCRKILAKDPCIEENHPRLIICYQNLGMRDIAIRQFYLCEETLKKELSVRPSDYTRSLFQALMLYYLNCSATGSVNGKKEPSAI
jgi:DNA-binding SARP family transcriptional activator